MGPQPSFPVSVSLWRILPVKRWMIRLVDELRPTGRNCERSGWRVRRQVRCPPWRMKPFCGSASRCQHVEYPADAGSCGDLDGAARHLAHLAAVDLVGVALLHQETVLVAVDGDGEENYHHVLHRRRQGLSQEVLQYFAVGAQAELVEQLFHDRSTAGIADSAVVQRVHPSSCSSRTACRSRQRF